MLAKSIFFALCLASFAAAEPIPYPRVVAAKTVSLLKSLPVFGNKHGNTQPTLTRSEIKKNSFKRTTGGQVQVAANAVKSTSNQDGIGAGSDTYRMYFGDGSSSSGWPTRANWVSFEDMFNNNKNTMFASCSGFGVAGNSGPEVGAIYNAIQQVAEETLVDHRFILAIMMQESGGCVRVDATNFGVRNPGLMQDHNGPATCNSDITGVIQNPCPDDVILQMIRDGTAGTNDGDGLAQCINESNLSNDADFYRAARIYNSGSIAANGQLQAGIATHCYASDIANRLTGWVSAPHGCTCDSDPSSCGL